MLIRDPRDEPLLAGDPASAERLEPAVLDMLGFAGDPVGRADKALAEDPGLVLAHCLKAHAYVFALEPRFRAKALESVAAGEAALTVHGGGGERERLHLLAARAWAEGDPALALRCFDDLLAAHPRDLLALMFAHQADFFGGGDPAALQARPARALEALAPDASGRGFALGMLAFGLEEAGNYARAEALGREAVARNPRDVWAIHAVAHVLEMQGRDEEGVDWYGGREADWAEASFFAVHNAWHLALYHLDREDADAALAVYDRRLRPGRRSLVLNLCDAASLLWRLHLAGVDAGPERWAEVADGLVARAEPGHHVFNDVHLAFALAGAGRLADLEALASRLAALAAGPGDYARRLRALGLPATRAALAFGSDRYGDAADLLAGALPDAAAMAGSHAQREILPRTLVEAALRDRRRTLARGLLEVPLARKPRSPALARDLARCAAA